MKKSEFRKFIKEIICEVKEEYQTANNYYNHTGTVRVNNLSNDFISDVTFKNGKIVSITPVKGYGKDTQFDLDAVNKYLKTWTEQPLSRIVSAGISSEGNDSGWEDMAMSGDSGPSQPSTM